MAKAKHRPTSAAAPDQSSNQSAPALKQEPAGGKRPGMFENAANWLLSRLPWFKDRYETWGKARKIIVALVLYLVILPVIPIVIAAVMYVRDPEGFKKSKAMPILGAIIVAQLGLFGVIAVQPPQVSDTANTVQSKDATDGTSQEGKADKKSSAAPSKPSEGRRFENCDAAFKAGVHDIARSDSSYRSELDRDGDGVACER